MSTIETTDPGPVPRLPVDYSIEWATPSPGSHQSVYMLDLISFRLSLVVGKDDIEIQPNDFDCRVWTNLYHKDYNEGDWHSVTLTYQNVRIEKDNKKVIFVYGVEMLPTCLGKYSFTYRSQCKIKARLQSDVTLKWAGGFGHIQVVLPVKHATLWMQEPEADQVVKNVYLGNYQAAVSAPERGFDCLLNMSDDAEVFVQQLSQPVIYRHWPLPAGADKPIHPNTICEAVNWLRSMSDRCDKVLVFSRRGYGRAGSVLLAYIFAFNKNLSFQDVLQYVQKRHLVYNHQGLRDTLYKLYPRE